MKKNTAAFFGGLDGSTRNYKEHEHLNRNYCRIVTTTSGNHTQWPQQMTARTTTYQGLDTSSFLEPKGYSNAVRELPALKLEVTKFARKWLKLWLLPLGRIESFNRYCIEIKKKNLKMFFSCPSEFWILRNSYSLYATQGKTILGLSQFFSQRSCTLRLGTSLAFSPLVALQEGSHDPLGLFFVIQSLVQSPRKG